VTQLSRRESMGSASHRKAVSPTAHRSLLTCCAVVLCAALVVAAVKLDKPGSTPVTHAAPAIRYLGVYEADAPKSYAGIQQFAKSVGREPNLVGYYDGWGEAFQLAFAETAARHGATTLVQIDPTGISLAKVAAGDYDYYLIAFADQVAAFKHRVVISFGHEMNGYWFTWGYTHTSPRVFVAAWRHMVTVFREHGASNVIWLWQVNSDSSKTGPVQDWWPGSSYVNWVGISGYYFVPNETFSYIFAPVVSQVRKFTSDPVLIAETGVGKHPDQVLGIGNLFLGLLQEHDIGLVWFDQDTPGPTVYTGGDWRLEGNQQALAAFRKELASSDAHG
jgi:mannan endo-1,4-beta-mannosidase